VKAKVVRTYVDKMITLAKDGSLHARRQVRSSSSRGCSIMHGNSNSSNQEQRQHQLQQSGRHAGSAVRLLQQ
jgi:ribosomal protein L17